MFNVLMTTPWTPLVGLAWVVFCAVVVGAGFVDATRPRTLLDPVGAMVGAAFGIITLAAAVVAVGMGHGVYALLIGIGG